MTPSNPPRGKQPKRPAPSANTRRTHPPASGNTDISRKKTAPQSASPRRSGGRYTGKYSRNQSSLPPILPIALIILLILIIGLGIWAFAGSKDKPSTPFEPESSLPISTTDEQTQPPETTTLPPGPEVVATATVGSTGDLLMHKQLFHGGFKSVCKLEDGTYDFSPIFKYISPYLNELDLAAANLETTFGGPDCGTPYQGNPLFNTPDELAGDLKKAGFDMMLTANNHAGDTKAEGIIRTVEKVREAGLTALGTNLEGEDKKYEIVDINGIKLGMISYTYATSQTSDLRPSLNLNAPLKKAGLINYFLPNNLNKFYDEAQTHLENMRADGAEAILFFLHWGTEYELEANATQKAMAQKLCDLGVDVIIGGHPHVIQPMDLLESTVDPEHKTVVLYSMGNAVSNQRVDEMRLKTGHTEDGLLFSVTFEKYDDGSVHLASADVLPTWTRKHNDGGGLEYNILPLDNSRRSEWADLFGLSNTSPLENSYDRTMKMVGAGLQKCNDYLTQAKQTRENPTA